MSWRNCAYLGDEEKGKRICLCPSLRTPSHERPRVSKEFCDQCRFFKQGLGRVIPSPRQCIHLGGPTGETQPCPTCGGTVQVHLHECKVHGKCSLDRLLPGIDCCSICRDKQVTTMKWAYGVTTVPQRRKTLLPKTLASLKAAGFDAPHLFADGTNDQRGYKDEFGLETTTRFPLLHAYGNWTLAIAELYIRNPEVDRYALFQDDLVVCKGLRAYLDRCVYPEGKGYWNLYTIRDNAIPGRGWVPSRQKGKGALGLVFDRETVITLLTHQRMLDHPKDPAKGRNDIDGGVCAALRKAGRREWVHVPGLLQHTGTVSAIGNKPTPFAEFVGEDFDARGL